MRPEGNHPLDLNHFPEEYEKQALEESSTTTAASTDNGRFDKKKRDGKDQSGKIYECRFCSLKFCKSQALGGHMNRHRQERETETLNRARELVFNNDSIAGCGAAHMAGLRDRNLGSGGSMLSSCFQQARNINGDSSLNLRPVYPRVPEAPVSLPQPQHILHSNMYASPPASSSHHPFQARQAAAPPSPTNDCCVGLVLASGNSHNQPQNPDHPLFAMDGGSWNCGRGFVQHATNPSPMDLFRDDI